MSRVLLIDNYDSFTYNLYQYLGELGAETLVYRNDAITFEQAQSLRPDHVVISPGPGHPGTPRDFGVCTEILLKMAPTVPTLGVCLGHQGMAHHLGGKVVRAPQIVHGKTDRIEHDGAGLFAGLPQPLTVMRYHSLVVSDEGLPECLEVSARTADGLIMAMRHRDWPLVGMQFHPESIGTPEGHGLLRNFLKMEAP